MKPSAISSRLLVILFTLVTTSSLAQNRPNILILITDDMGVDAFSPYQLGTDVPNTPNLNAMASNGLLFNNAWAYPTCAPSRAALITGRYGNKNGITRSGPNLAEEEISLFEYIDTLTNGAYADAVFGKWHLGNANSPNTQGADYYTGNLFSGVSDYYKWERTTNGVTDTSHT
jgi:arylsulfatase A-like enzyme